MHPAALGRHSTAIASCLQPGRGCSCAPWRPHSADPATVRWPVPRATTTPCASAREQRPGFHRELAADTARALAVAVQVACRTSLASCCCHVWPYKPPCCECSFAADGG